VSGFDINEAGWDAYEAERRFDRDSHREPPRRDPVLTHDDHLERTVLAAGLTCAYDDRDEPVNEAAWDAAMVEAGQ
jgi:hypothetical protein